MIYFNMVNFTIDTDLKADEVREEVNLWAEKETKGLIKDLLPLGSVHSLTSLIYDQMDY